MMFLRFIVVVALFAFSLSEKPFTIAKIPNNGAQKIVLDVSSYLLKPTADMSLYSIAVEGKQGAGKSSLLRALASYFELQHADFESGDSNMATTIDVSTTSPSPSGVYFIDKPGHDDPQLCVDSGIDSANVDAMFAHLLAPITNTLIHSFVRTIGKTDLEMLSAYCDEKLNMGAIQVKSDIKPTLILAIRGKRLDILKDGVKVEATPEEYVNFILPTNHVARRTFGQISAVLIPELSNDDLAKIQKDSYHPREVPVYWEAIEKIAQAAVAAQNKNKALYWTGKEIAAMLTSILPSVNSMSTISIPTVRNTQILNRVEAVVTEKVAAMKEALKGAIANPFDKESEFLNKVTSTKTTHSDAVKAAFKVHEPEKELWNQITKKISTAFEAAGTWCAAESDKRKEQIRQESQKKYETASLAVTRAQSTAASQLTGQCAAVHDFITAAANEVTALNQVVDAAGKDSKQAKRLKDQIKGQVNGFIDSLNTANQLAFINKKNELKSASGPGFQADFHEHHDHCGNGDEWHHFDMGARFPQYFAHDKRRLLKHVDCHLDSNHGGGGRLVLEGNNQDYWFHQNAGSGEKGHGAAGGFNPHSNKIAVKIWGWGWGDGNCNNRKWVNAAKCSVTTNGLWDNPYYAGEYSCQYNHV